MVFAVFLSTLTLIFACYLLISALHLWLLQSTAAVPLIAFVIKTRSKLSFIMDVQELIEQKRNQ